MLPPPLQLLTRGALPLRPAPPVAPSRGPLLSRLPAPPMRSAGSRPRGPIGCGNVLNSTRTRPSLRAQYALLQFPLHRKVSLATEHAQFNHRSNPQATRSWGFIVLLLPLWIVSVWAFVGRKKNKDGHINFII